MFLLKFSINNTKGWVPKITYMWCSVFSTLTSHQNLVRHIGLQPVEFIHFCHVKLAKFSIWFINLENGIFVWDFDNLLEIKKETFTKRKRKRSDSVLWQKPLHQQKCQKGKVTTQTTPQKSSIKQRLRTDLGRSVGVTKATQLVWLTGLRAHLPTNRNSRLIKRTHV